MIPVFIFLPEEKIALSGRRRSPFRGGWLRPWLSVAEINDCAVESIDHAEAIAAVAACCTFQVVDLPRLSLWAEVPIGVASLKSPPPLFFSRPILVCLGALSLSLN